MALSGLRRGSRALLGASRGHSGWQKPSLSSDLPLPGDGSVRKVTLLPGDGAPIEWESFPISGLKASPHYVTSVPKEVMDSIARNRACLKGGLYTTVGGGLSSLNLQIRKELDLFAHVCHAYDLPGVRARHKHVDVIIVRENTEGEYAGLEHEVVPGVVESIKVITEPNSRRIARYAFEYAVLNNRKRVTCVHKANIMKLTDGLFLKVCTEVAASFPQIAFDQIIVDNACMQMVSKPQQFDVLLTPNLYGNIIDNIGAGLTGGTGYLPGGSVGSRAAVFEQGASAGNVGLALAGKGVANPVALMLAGAMLLKHLKLGAQAGWVEDAVYAVLGAGGVRTPDMGGEATTAQFAQAVVQQVHALKAMDEER